MYHKKIIKSLLATLFPAILVSALIIPAINSQTSFSTQQDFKTTTPPTSFTTPSVTEELDLAYVRKSNWTWPNDVYETTKGYKYTGIDNPDSNIFTIDRNGFKVNPAFPEYSKDNDWISGSGVSGFVDYSTTDHLINVLSQTYNVVDDSVSVLTTNASKKMYFGKTSNDKLTGLGSYELSVARPYLNIQFPIVDHRIVHTTGWKQGCKTISWGGSSHESRSMLRFYSNNAQFYTGNADTINNNIRNPNWHQSPVEIIDINYHWHYEFGVHQVNLSIFNDYDQTGNLVGTHLLNHGDTFNSVLPTVNIDSSKFNKNISVIPQNVLADGIITLTNAQSIPAMGGGTMTAVKNPAAGTITFTYKPSYIFYKGELQKYTGPGTSQVIGGFSLLNTYILSKTGYPDFVVVDRFMNSITNAGVIDARELGKYLDISTVPTGATFTIPEDSITMDLVAGTIEFDINASNGFNFDNSLTNQTTPDHPIKLQLTPRITKFKPKDPGIDGTLVSEFHDLVFGVNGKANLSELKKHIDIKAPVDGADYYLVPGSYEIHTGDGTATFSLYASEYYDSMAQPVAGSVSELTTHFPIDLSLKPLPSKVSVKTVEKPSTRVDDFISSVSDPSSGKITNIDLLKEYVSLENIPSAAEYSIDLTSVEYDDYNSDFFYEYVNFDLIISAYNENTRTTPINKSIPLRVKLEAYHLETKLTAKTTYDKSVRVDRLLPKVMNASNTVVNRAVLEEYVNIESLPAASVMQIEDIKIEDHAGILIFNIVPTISYGKDSLRLEKEKYPISLVLTMRHTPTTIAVKENVKDPQRVDRFANEIKALDKADLNTYLNKYLTVDYDPHLSVTEISSVQNIKYDDIGTLTMDVVVSEAYDAEAELTTNYAIPVSLNLGRKYAPTAVSLKTSYPQASYIQDFRDVVASSNQTELYDFLKRFLNGMDTIPTGAAIAVIYNNLLTDETTGVLAFTLTADQQYDADSDLQSTLYTSPIFEIQLIPNNVPPIFSTNVQWKADAPSVRTASDFFESVSPNNQVDYEALSLHLDFVNLPINAQFTITNKDLQFTNPNLLTFDVVINQWWDNGELKPTDPTDAVQTKTFSLTKNLLVINLNSISNTFPWWWIAVAIGSVTLIATAWFLWKNHTKEEEFKDKALSL